ncbi:MAG: cupredoxin domain-containing protein [Acidimicrobiales bacterium]
MTQTLRFTIEEPGEYQFVCDVHPAMTGTIQAV